MLQARGRLAVRPHQGMKDEARSVSAGRLASPATSIEPSRPAPAWTARRARLVYEAFSPSSGREARRADAPWSAGIAGEADVADSAAASIGGFPAGFAEEAGGSAEAFS